RSHARSAAAPGGGWRLAGAPSRRSRGEGGARRVGESRAGPRSDAPDQGHLRSGRHLRARAIRGGRGETMIPTVQEIGRSLHDLLAADRHRFVESARAIPVPDLAEGLRALPPERATELGWA